MSSTVNSPDWSADGTGPKSSGCAPRAAIAPRGVSGLSATDAFERDYLVSEFDDDLF